MAAGSKFRRASDEHFESVSVCQHCNACNVSRWSQSATILIYTSHAGDVLSLCEYAAIVIYTSHAGDVSRWSPCATIVIHTSHAGDVLSMLPL